MYTLTVSLIALFILTTEASQREEVSESNDVEKLFSSTKSLFRFSALLLQILYNKEEKILTSTQIAQYRKDFIALINKNKTLVSGEDCHQIFSLYKEKKIKHIISKEEDPLFLDESTFETIIPILLERESSLFHQPGSPLFYTASFDPILINKLIYKYNYFPKDTYEVLSTILYRIHRQGFILNNTFFVDDIRFYNEDLGKTVFKQDDKKYIEYIKTCLMPPINDFVPEKFSKDYKKKLWTFLLCVKRLSIENKIIIPRVVLNSCIIKPLYTYEINQSYKKNFIQWREWNSSIDINHDIVQKVRSFMMNDFEAWFDNLV